MKIGMLFNGVVAPCSRIPIVRIPALAVTQAAGTAIGVDFARARRAVSGRRDAPGDVPEPVVTPTDGETADTACWVRHIDGEQFQVFAINCAHLGCPVRWFPQSGLFMCPCHGGAYYADGSRASGPPERGLFEYPFKVATANLTIQAGEMPTPGPPDRAS